MLVLPSSPDLWHGGLSNTNTDSLYFLLRCWSQVGRTGRKQQISLGFGCGYHGIAVHEIGHALGTKLRALNFVFIVGNTELHQWAEGLPLTDFKKSHKGTREYILPLMACTGRLCSKGVPFSCFRPVYERVGRSVISIRLQNDFIAVKNSRKFSCFVIYLDLKKVHL